MPFSLAANWWSFALRGVLAVLFGVFTLVKPELSLAMFVFLFAWYAFVEGSFNLLGAVRSTRAGEPWWPLLLEGALSVGVALLLFGRPDLSWRAMLTFLAFWGLTTGALELVAASMLRKRFEGEWLLASAGVASVTLGTVLALAPTPNPLKVVFWLGVYAFAFGGALVALGLRLRGYNVDREQSALGPPLADP
ncbi:MAG TPA: DUF308 domain-containing protein [Polyangiaceae bacterium]|nr:DUF308 domain-containing protein [Polyangiaceae bacterium]